MSIAQNVEIRCLELKQMSSRTQCFRSVVLPNGISTDSRRTPGDPRNSGFLFNPPTGPDVDLDGGTDRQVDVPMQNPPEGQVQVKSRPSTPCSTSVQVPLWLQGLEWQASNSSQKLPVYPSSHSQKKVLCGNADLC